MEESKSVFTQEYGFQYRYQSLITVSLCSSKGSGEWTQVILDSVQMFTTSRMLLIEILLEQRNCVVRED